MTDKERYDELIKTIETLADDLAQERKENWGKTYTITEVIEMLDGLTEYQE